MKFWLKVHSSIAEVLLLFVIILQLHTSHYHITEYHWTRWTCIQQIWLRSAMGQLSYFITKWVQAVQHQACWPGTSLCWWERRFLYLQMCNETSHKVVEAQRGGDGSLEESLAVGFNRFNRFFKEKSGIILLAFIQITFELPNWNNYCLCFSLKWVDRKASMQLFKQKTAHIQCIPSSPAVTADVWTTRVWVVTLSCHSPAWPWARGLFGPLKWLSCPS